MGLCTLFLLPSPKMLGQAEGGWWGGRGGGGQEALGCFFSLFPDSFVATDGLPSSPQHLGSQLISSLMPLAQALYLAQWSFSKLGFWSWGPLDEWE